jgi:hypothetical protein
VEHYHRFPPLSLYIRENLRHPRLKILRLLLVLGSSAQFYGRTSGFVNDARIVFAPTPFESRLGGKARGDKGHGYAQENQASRDPHDGIFKIHAVI